MRNEDNYCSIKVSKKNRYWLRELKLELHYPSLNNLMEKLIALGYEEVKRREKVKFEMQLMNSYGE